MYGEVVMEHFEHPRNVGEVEGPDGVGEVGNPVCGDTTRITIKVRDDRLVDVKFQTYGCAAAVASSSMATEIAKGRSLAKPSASDLPPRSRRADRSPRAWRCRTRW